MTGYYCPINMTMAKQIYLHFFLKGIWKRNDFVLGYNLTYTRKTQNYMSIFGENGSCQIFLCLLISVQKKEYCFYYIFPNFSLIQQNQFENLFNFFLKSALWLASQSFQDFYSVSIHKTNANIQSLWWTKQKHFFKVF